MALLISPDVLASIHAHGEQAYPEEGVGLLFGCENEHNRNVTTIFPLVNAREDNARHNRYLVGPQEMLRGEQEAMRLGLDVLGVFHSHPDHPNRPSEFDRQWALPWFSYVITSVLHGQAVDSRSWLLSENRESFIEEELIVQDVKSNP